MGRRRLASARTALAAVITTVLVAALTSCGAPSTGTPDSTADQDLSVHEDVPWVLVAGTVDGEVLPVPATTEITVTFEQRDGPAWLLARVCNSLSGELVGWPEEFSLGTLAQTEMWCEDADLMATETALAEALPRVDAAAREGDTLMLTGTDVELELRTGVGETTPDIADDSPTVADMLPPDVIADLESLAGRAWQLVSGTVDGVAVTLVPDHAATLSVTVDPDGAHLLGGHACNWWSIELGASLDAGVTSTAMLCPDNLMAVESAVQRAVSRLTSVTVDGETLTLLGDGVELVWTDRPPLDVAGIQDTAWSMETLTVAGEPADVPLGTTWSIDSDGTLLATSLCLVLRGEWVVSGADVLLTSAQQDGDCGEADNLAAGTALAALSNGFSASLADGVLTTTSLFGEVATHTPAPIP